jgi:hypothetical protein
MKPGHPIVVNSPATTAHKITRRCVSAQDRARGPPVQVAGVENAGITVHGKRRAAEDNLEGIVVEVAENRVT